MPHSCLVATVSGGSEDHLPARGKEEHGYGPSSLPGAGCPQVYPWESEISEGTARVPSTSSGPETMVHGGTVRPCPTQLPCTVWLSITLIPRIVGDTRVTQHWEPQMPQQVPVPVL